MLILSLHQCKPRVKEEKRFPFQAVMDKQYALVKTSNEIRNDEKVAGFLLPSSNNFQDQILLTCSKGRIGEG